MVINIIIINIVVVFWNGSRTLPAEGTLMFSHASFYKRKTLFNWNIPEKSIVKNSNANHQAVLLSHLEMWVSGEKVKGHN